MRWYRFGDPLAGGTFQKPRGMTEEQAFHWFMPGDPPEIGCWDWTGMTSASYGYGIFYLDGHQQIRAHVAAYRIYVGPTNGLYVLHHCDRPVCVHPRCLHLGTQTDNLAEMVERGRQARGSRNGHAKLIEADVDMIRGSTLTQKALAEMFDVRQSTISRIKSGKRWG